MVTSQTQLLECFTPTLRAVSILVLAACKDSSESARSSPKRLGKKVSEKRSTNHLTYRERPYIVDKHMTHEASKQPDSRGHMG